MDEHSFLNWTMVTDHIEAAALTPQSRDELLLQVLHDILTAVPLIGTALIWPCRTKKIPWKVLYTGARKSEMQRWLSARLETNLEVTAALVQHDLSLSGMPQLMLVPLSAPGTTGLWILWPAPLATITDDVRERCRSLFEAVLEVESIEEQFFLHNSSPLDSQLMTALAHGEGQALSTLLSFSRVMGRADLAYWGKVRRNEVEIVSHVGAKHTNFGFVLPLGSGIGGRVAKYGTIIKVGDYRNSPYRDSDVVDIIDSEQIRAGICIPIPDTVAQTGAVLYVTRRSVSPMSLAECLLLLRLTHSIGPLTHASSSSTFYMPAMPERAAGKAAWRHLLVHAQHISAIETWLEQVVQGGAIVVNEQDQPYVPKRVQELDQLRALQEKNTVQVVQLAFSDMRTLGQIYLRPSIALPPRDWPEFFADIVALCNVVIMRMEQGYSQLVQQRERWLLTLRESKHLHLLEQEGYRLGLPIERGQLWAIGWHATALQELRQTRMRMMIDSVVLDRLRSPLLLLDDIGVILLREQEAEKSSPSALRDELLKCLTGGPIWLIHGMAFQSLQELKARLMQAIALVRKARSEEHEQYVKDVHAFGLDSLLENPRLSDDLGLFAQKMLAPLIAYDTQNGTELTETYVLVQILGSLQEVAAQLRVHVNTVRYRMQKVQEVLGGEYTAPMEQATRLLAALIWQRKREDSSNKEEC
jgi:sugar diacid utilization regulator